VLVSVRATAMVDGQRRALESGDALGGGDVFAYHVRVDRDAYLTVLQFLSDGTQKVLFPAAGEVLVRAGEETRIPRDEELWFAIDDSTPGVEHLYLIASVAPLAEADADLAAIVGALRQSPAAGGALPSSSAPTTSAPAPPAPAPSAPAGVPAPPPHHRRYPRMRAREVHLVRVKAPQGVTYRGRTSTDGVGVIHFPIRHR
jgi:hypothetical protein